MQRTPSNHNSSSGPGTANALVLVAEGSEEMETVITVDCLRRAGVVVVMCQVDQDEGPASSLNPVNSVKCSRGVSLVPDIPLSRLTDVQAQAFRVIICPGGLKGAETFAKSERVLSLLRYYHDHPAKMVAAICAAPIALKAAGIAKEGPITSHPSVANELQEAGYTYISSDRVVKSAVPGHSVITSRGPGTTFDFALCLIEALLGAEKSSQIRQQLLLD